MYLVLSWSLVLSGLALPYVFMSCYNSSIPVLSCLLFLVLSYLFMLGLVLSIPLLFGHSISLALPCPVMSCPVFCCLSYLVLLLLLSLLVLCSHLFCCISLPWHFLFRDGYFSSIQIFWVGIMEVFLDSINVGWSTKYGSAIYCARIEHVEFAWEFTEVELKELLRENLKNVDAVAFHVSVPSFNICCVVL
jgi:hypothetical protein